MTQQERILAETAKSLAAVDKYSDLQIKSLLQSLQQASVQIKGELLSLAGRNAVTTGLQIRQEQLQTIQKRIDAIVEQLNQQQSALFTGITRDSFQNGVHSAINEFGNIGFPTYDSLNQADRLSLTADAMSVIDTQALDFLANYHLQLLGNVSQQLADNIKQELNTGIITGSSIADVVEKIGGVITNPDEFRVAGKTVFKTAQQRIETITRTEILRAHNQGRAKFYQTVGVQKVTWITAQDERTCRECAPLDGKEFPIAEAPSLPRHPMCRCTTFVSAPLTICGQGEPIAMAAATGAGCIMPANQVQQLSKVQQASTAKVQQAFQSGDPAQLQLLTIKEIQGLAMQNGVAIARTKSDFIALLDQAEIGIDHGQLAGPALKAKLAQYKIGALRSKDEMIKLLLAKQQTVTQVIKQVIPVVQLQALVDLAKQELDQLLSSVTLPTGVSDYQAFLASVTAVESKIATLSTDPAFVNIIAQPLQKVQQLKSTWQASLAAKSSGDLKTFAKDAKLTHWQWASKDEIVTLLSSNDPVQRQSAVTFIEAKYAKWAVKNVRGYVPNNATPVPPQPKNIIKPAPTVRQVSPPVANSPTSTQIAWYFDTGIANKSNQQLDDIWDLIATDPEKQFKYKRNADDLGGGHVKEIWKDSQGHQWLFKPVEPGSSVIPEAEVCAYKLGRLLDPRVVEVRKVTLRGRVGTIQRFIEGIDAKASDLNAFAFEKIPTSDLEQLQRQRVFDWLISNHDSHGANFIRGADGHLYGIDKGQAWKHFPSDKLALDYHPNERFGSSEPVYNLLYQLVKSGKLSLDWHSMRDAIASIEKIADTDLTPIMQPYLSARFAGNPTEQRNFMTMLVDRKNNLRIDFERHLKSIDKNFMGFDKLDDAPISSSLDKKATGKKSAQEIKAEKALTDAPNTGWQGTTIDYDGGDVDDQGLLVFTESVAGKPKTVFQMKILESSDVKIRSVIEQTIPSSMAVGKRLLEDEQFAETITEAVKSIVIGTKSMRRISAALELEGRLLQLSQSADQEVKAMAQLYLKWIAGIRQNRAIPANRLPVWFRQQTIAPYLRRQAPAKVTTGKAPFTVSKRYITLENRKLVNGKEVSSTGKVMSADQTFPIWNHQNTVEYELTFGDGTTATYVPSTTDNHSYFAYRGKLEFHCTGKPTPELLQRIVEHGRELGIDSRLASGEDLELMYLLKHGVVLKDVNTTGYTKILADLDTKNASTSERIRVLRDYWSKKLNVPDVSKLPSYRPEGVMQFNTQTGGAGYRQQYRFDVSETELQQKIPGLMLRHYLTGVYEDDYGQFFETVLKGNQAMVSSVEKARIGLPVSGMHPTDDVNSGGGSYVFTSIENKINRSAIYFKARNLLRLDTISYDDMCLGDVREGYRLRHSRVNIADWQRLARSNGNATQIKHSISLVDEIETIAVSSDKDRIRVINAFQSAGFAKLPDGRKIENVVRKYR